MNYRKIFIPLIISSIALGCFVFSPIAHGYALSDGYTNGMTLSSGSFSSFGNWNAAWNNLSSPFQNFATNLESIGSTTVSVATVPISTSVPDGIAPVVHDVFEKFDAWLYGIAGFHIAAIFTAILTIFDWILGFLKNGTDWLLSALH